MYYALYLAFEQNVIRITHDEAGNLSELYIRDANFDKHIFDENFNYNMTKGIDCNRQINEEKVRDLLLKVIEGIGQNIGIGKLKESEIAIVQNVRSILRG